MLAKQIVAHRVAFAFQVSPVAYWIGTIGAHEMREPRFHSLTRRRMQLGSNDAHAKRQADRDWVRQPAKKTCRRDRRLADSIVGEKPAAEPGGCRPVAPKLLCGRVRD